MERARQGAEKAKPRDDAAITVAEEQAAALTREAREAAGKAKEIEDAVYDLKAVNPSKRVRHPHAPAICSSSSNSSPRKSPKHSPRCGRWADAAGGREADRETGMKSSNLTLGAVLNSPNQYVIPVFQRYYRWDQPEWDKLKDDLADLRRPGPFGLVAGSLLSSPVRPVWMPRSTRRSPPPPVRWTI